MGYRVHEFGEMVVSSGNPKIGDAYIVNRPSGITCTPTCQFLTGKGVPEHAKCYALSTEQRFVRALAIARNNLRISSLDLRAVLEDAARTARPVRFHERGDFGNGKPHSIDGRYVLAIERALDSARPMPRAWSYTHIYHKRLAKLADRGLTIYASVHNSDDIEQATIAGFGLGALVLPFRPDTCKPQVRGLSVYDGAPSIKKHGKQWLVCPAQRTHDITCDRCGYCIAGRGNVAFLTH